METSVVLGYLALAGGIFSGIMGYRAATAPRRETPEQARERIVKTDSEAMSWYRNLMEDTQKRYEELEQENAELKARIREETESHAIAISNQGAISIKRQLEYDERAAIERNRRKSAELEVAAYVLNRNELIRLLKRHAPGVEIPEVPINGNSTPI
jgi:predicted RNase H-like nuclease (RuvC/YqgF family)